MRNRLALFLPGIFLLGFNIGTGSVTTMAKAGASYGMALLWTVALSCVATFVMINAYGRYTLATGETALQAFRKHIHPAVGLFFIVALTAGVAGSVMGVMGIVADISFEWSKAFVAGGIAPVYWAALFCALVYFIFWNGRTQVFERSLAVIVAVMAASFVVNFFLMMPPPGDIARGLLPTVPDMTDSERGGQGPLLLIASMVGTTLFSGLFIIRTTLVKEAGWTMADERQQRRDALFAVIMMFVISAAIMAAAAGTLFAEGLGLEQPAQMISLLEPLAGPLAASIFAIGIIAAGVSSQFPNVLMLPWLLCDYFQNSARHDAAAIPDHGVPHFLARTGRTTVRCTTGAGDDRFASVQRRAAACNRGVHLLSRQSRRPDGAIPVRCERKCGAGSDIPLLAGDRLYGLHRLAGDAGRLIGEAGYAAVLEMVRPRRSGDAG